MAPLQKNISSLHIRSIKRSVSTNEYENDDLPTSWVRCTINRSHSTPCKKAEFEHLQIFPGHCLVFFLSVSGKICHSPIKKVKRQPTLIILFSQHSPFFGEQSKNPGWNPTRVRRYLGSAPGSLWQNSPQKDAFFCISLTNIDQCWITCTFKVE